MGIVASCNIALYCTLLNVNEQKKIAFKITAIIIWIPGREDKKKESGMSYSSQQCCVETT